MAVETTFDIGFGTTFDPTNLEEGLSKALARAERETENSAAKQVAAVAKAKLEEVKSVKAAENAKIEKRRASTRAQIELIRATPNITEEQKEQWIKAEEEAGRRGIEKLETRLKKHLSKIQESVVEEVRIINEGAEGRDAEKQREVEAVQEAEQQKVETVESSQSQQTAAVQDGTDERTGIIRDGGRRQSRALQEGNRSNLRSIEDFASGASQQLGGFMKTVTKALKSPVALGAAVVLAGRQIKRFLDSTAEAWRVEEQAQIALAAAARNNPYLNDRGVHQLRQFANEMQRLTGIDNVQVMGAQTRLAALGRNQQEIEQIVRTAADIAATGLMSYDQAVDELSQSFSGFTRRLERMFPELKNLTEEAKMAGDAVNVIAASVSGMAEQAMQSGVGSVQAFNNSVESMRRIIGQDWEQTMRPWRIALTNVINGLVAGVESAREFRDAMRDIGEDATASERLRAYEAELDLLRDRMLAIQGMTEASPIEAFVASTFGTPIRAIMGQAEVTVWNAESLAATTAERIAELEGLVEKYGETVGLMDQMSAAMDRAAAAAATAGTDMADNLADSAADAARRVINILSWGGDITGEAIRTLSQEAEMYARLATEEAARIELMQEHARIRDENLEKLEAEIRQIELRAAIEGRGLESAETQQQILNARISAHKALVSQIGDEVHYEQETMRQLQAEFLRQQIAAGNRLLDENMRHLETRRREITAIAELEGRATDDIRTQNELLDANVNAYQNQMRILRDLIDGTREEETARRAALEAQWAQYAQRKVSARAERQNLEEAIRLQDELRVRAERMYQSASGTIDEHQFQTELDRLETMRLAAARHSAEQEREIIREIYDFKAARGKDAIREELAFLEGELERAGHTLASATGTPREAAIREEIADIESMIDALNMSHVIQGIEKADGLFTRMLENVEGRGSTARVAEISALRLQLLEEEMERRREMGEDAARLAEEQARREVAIRQQAADKVREIHRRMIADLNSGFDTFIDAFRNMANNIATIWTNGIDRQTQEKLRANDAMVQSDEERAAKERRILKEAAYERHKAELFAWTANVTFATAQAGMATLTAFAEALKGTGPAGPAIAAINAALVAAVSATKVAAVISAKPNPPRFHTGTASVPGRTGQEVPAILMAGETVLPQGDFRNVMQAFGNMAGMAYRPAAPEMSVQVINNKAHDTRASTSFDGGKLRVVIDEIVNDGLAKGRYDRGLDQRDMRNGGRRLGTF